MLKLTLGDEYYDENQNEFILKPTREVVLEHSLRTIAKWETKYEKPFLTNTPKTPEEMLDYYLMMSPDGELKVEDINERVSHEIMNYIKSSNSATTVKRNTKKKNQASKIYTSEVLYALMFMNGVHISADRWHINRLMLTLEVISDYNTPADQKKMSKKEILKQNREINRQRREKLKTKG